MFGFSRRQPPPQLTYGKPIDFNANVPIFPPFAVMLTVMAGILLWQLTGKRFTYPLLSNMSVRVSILAAGIAFFKCVVFDVADSQLASAGSGALFTPVNGLATEGIYTITRNPMYCVLIFVVLPLMSLVFNTGWVVLLAPFTWAYLHFVVIAAEEKLLALAFGKAYVAYCEKVPRWLSA